MKRLLKWLAGIVLVLLLLMVALIGPINRTPLSERAFYKEMMAGLDTLQPVAYPAAKKIQAGWATVSITPAYNMPMAGYIPRPQFDSVHDSLFVRILAIDNGSVTCYFITTDLLLFPPALKDKLTKRLNEKGASHYFLYFSSTHTHNGVGGWDDSVLGRTALGEYHEEWLNQTALAITNEMETAYASRQPARISYFENDASEWVENRIAFENGQVDGKVRGVSIVRQDSSKGIVFTFSAHATSISKEIHQLSGDYPNETIKQLKGSGYSFGMFMAGMVGSHRFKYFPEANYDCIRREAEILTDKITSAASVSLNDSLSFRLAHVPIVFGPSQLRIEKNWKVRDWAFRSLALPLKGELTYIELGNLIFIGTPCDFSGEIFVRDHYDKWEASTGKHLVITSFNGDYAGYITYDPHYETLSKEEVMAMNWVGPYYGSYFSEMIRKLISK